MKKQNSDCGQLSITKMHAVIKIGAGVWLIVTRAGSVFAATSDPEKFDYIKTIQKIREDFERLTGVRPGLKESKDNVDTFWER